MWGSSYDDEIISGTQYKLSGDGDPNINYMGIPISIIWGSAYNLYGIPMQFIRGSYNLYGDPYLFEGVHLRPAG